MGVRKVHHLDCAAMRPRLGRLNEQRRFVGHVLAVEFDSGEVLLVDTGIGSQARQAPREWLGASFTALFRPDTAAGGSASAQLAALGLRDAVRHIVLTHLDGDHAGGLADFPDATVHVHSRELEAYTRRGSAPARLRYRPIILAHRPDIVTYTENGESWQGFPAARNLPGVPPEVVAIPLPGHTRGHSAIAVAAGDGWLIHCGDGYFHAGVVDPARAPVSRAAARLERALAGDYRRVRANHERLRELAGRREVGIEVFSAHDPGEFERLAAMTTAAPPPSDASQRS
jgi:glyoxylase-like metal-dependent hydrolase (beta-lactamase superfamily II)